MKWNGLAIDRYYCAGKSLLTHFVMKHHAKWEPEKKDPFCGSFFFFTGLRPVPPLGQYALSKSAGLHPKCLHKSALALWFRKIRTYNVTNTQQQLRTTQQQLRTGLTYGQLAEQFDLFIQTPLDRRGMASMQSNSIFSFKHHLTGEAWPACRAILPFHSNTT